MPDSRPDSPPRASDVGAPLACPWCGQLHRRVALRSGDTLQCVRCRSTFARASDWPGTLAWVLTALLLWIPANLLPIVQLAQFGNSRESRLFTGAVSLWQQGYPWISVLVVLCGIAAPLALLLAFAALLVPLVAKRPTDRLRFLVRWLRALELWSIPEVYLLAVLVAFIKLGSVVPAEPAPGLWCHAGMALALLIAWRRFDIDAAAQALATETLPPPARA